MAPSASHNIAHFLPAWAGSAPTRRALLAPTGRHGSPARAWRGWTFAELDQACDRLARRLAAAGVQRGMLSLLMVRPGLDFYALTFALFKIGAVPVLIDPGMGWRSFMSCVEQSRPEAFLGVPAAHLLRLLFPGRCRSIRIKAVLGALPFPGASGLSRGSGGPAGGAFAVQPVEPEDLAAVLFTSGSTGPAKGVAYTHRLLTTQVELLRREYHIGPGDIDLPCFPLFGLFSTALGASAVIPDMDPSRPAQVDPQRIIEPILTHGVTYSFGSPTLWARVGRACAERGIRLPTLTRVIMAGAPVAAPVHETLLGHVLPPGAQTYTPYGATEALPVTQFTGAEMLAETAADTRAGAGMCVGRPLPEVTVRVIRIVDGPLECWSPDLGLDQGEIGEIVVSGATVTSHYHNLPEATRGSKIRAGSVIWHRMGDAGYLDARGRIWFCGRLAHRVQTEHGTLYTIRCEAIVNAVPGVQRSALVGVGPDRSRQRPLIVVEPVRGSFPRNARQRAALAARVLQATAAHPLTRELRQVLFHRSFPVDIRHNAKIRREALAQWAADQLRNGD